MLKYQFPLEEAGGSVCSADLLQPGSPHGDLPGSSAAKPSTLWRQCCLDDMAFPSGKLPSGQWCKKKSPVGVVSRGTSSVYHLNRLIMSKVLLLCALRQVDRE